MPAKSTASAPASVASAITGADDFSRLAITIPTPGPNESIIAPQAGPQTAFLACDADIIIFGGAAGGGKTWSLLLDPLRYAALEPVRDFGAVIFRRTAPQIKAQGGLWDESGKIYPLAGGKPNRTDFAWDWPQYGTRIRFAHMQYSDDMYNWQGSQIPYIAFDELTHFSETAFFYMLSRNRSTCGVKPRLRATTNPDADSWVKKFIAPWVDDEYPWQAQPGQILRFYRENDVTYWLRPGEPIPEGVTADRIKTATFIPSKLSDNPALLRVNPGYYANLMAMPLLERERLLGGPLAWKIRANGNTFKREWFPIVDRPPRPEDVVVLLRYWDMASTEAKLKKNGMPANDPDYTAGIKIARTRDGDYYVLDVVHDRRSPKGNEELVTATAEQDGYACTQFQEQEPGSSGKATADRYRTLLDGFEFRAVRPSGSKELRANGASSQAEGRHIKLVRAWWNDILLNELVAFPNAAVHDDLVDALSGAIEQASKRARRGTSFATASIDVGSASSMDGGGAGGVNRLLALFEAQRAAAEEQARRSDMRLGPYDDDDEAGDDDADETAPAEASASREQRQAEHRAEHMAGLLGQLSDLLGLG